MLVHNGLIDLVFSYECVNAPTILVLETPMAGDIVNDRGDQCTKP